MKIKSQYHHHQNNNNINNSSKNISRCYFSLACSIGSISVACGSLLQLNSTSDRISFQRGLFLTSMGFVYFISLTDFFNKYFLETRQGIKFRKKYHLMVSDVMDITNKIVSAIQAAFSCLAGFIVCKSSCSKSFLYASHYVMEAYAWFGTAYFMYDIWSMYKVHTQKIADKLKIMNITTRKSLSSLSSSSSSSSSRTTLTDTGSIYDENYLPSKKEKTISYTTINGKFIKKKICNDDDIHSTNENENDNDNEDKPNKNDSENINLSEKYNSNEQNDIINDNEDDLDYGEVIEIPKDGNWGFLKYMIMHPVMMIHHIFIGTFGLIFIVYLRRGFGDCVYSFIYLMELSTPFVSLRSILSTIGMKNTQLYILNGIIMLITFFICRILMWPYVFYGYSMAVNRSFIQAIMGLPRGCKISISILFIPQVYWFYLMIKGAIKVFFTSKKCIQKDNNYELQQENEKLPTNLKLHNGRPANLSFCDNSTTQMLQSSSVQNQVKSPNQSRTLL